MALRMRWTTPVTYAFGENQRLSSHFNFSEYHDHRDYGLNSPAFFCDFKELFCDNSKNRRHNVYLMAQGKDPEPSFFEKLCMPIKKFFGYKKPMYIDDKHFLRQVNLSEGVMYSKSFNFEIQGRKFKIIKDTHSSDVKILKINRMWTLSHEAMPFFIKYLYIDGREFRSDFGFKFVPPFIFSKNTLKELKDS
jgi:hypothetical protein